MSLELTRELTIEEFEGGAIIERLQHELDEVIKDCCDTNKVPDSVREVNFKMKIRPDARRMMLDIGFETSSKLGKRHPVISRAFLDESEGTASELTAKEGDLFPDQEQNEPKITVIGGSRKGAEN